ncbi:MAG TPA: YhfC family glutamic-type intramembrane protease [Dehalococcoidales bacterium]|nr:YhfC family glutamic-type intramembrane protease [Dehalococcoidales bacterium]
MIEIMLGQLRSFYDIPGLSPEIVLMAAGLALVFGLIWLSIFRPWRHRNISWIWVLITGAVLTWAAIAFIQVPLQIWTQDGLVAMLGQEGFIQWLYLSGIPIVLISGLIQEASKLLPVTVAWFTRKKHLEASAGFYYGAISGAGFGVMEAIWVHNMIFASGWSWQVVTLSGPTALLGFIERFFSIGFHIAASALAGYGWATGRRWQYFLLAAVLHGLLNYAAVLGAKNAFSIVYIEIYIAVIAIAAAAYAFWVMRRSRVKTEVVVPETPPAL